jgi:hypothetical protein
MAPVATTTSPHEDASGLQSSLANTFGGETRLQYAKSPHSLRKADDSVCTRDLYGVTETI